MLIKKANAKQDREDEYLRQRPLPVESAKKVHCDEATGMNHTIEKKSRFTYSR